MELKLVMAFGLGLGLGIVLTGLIALIAAQRAKQFTSSWLDQAQFERVRDLEAVIERMKESFAVISYEALHKNSDHLLNLTGETLRNQQKINEQMMENKKSLVDQGIFQISKELSQVNQVIQQYEKDREQKFGELNQQLKQATEQTVKLRDTTEYLQRVLSNTRVRGQWGERMAEDVLRTVGLLENINYTKQETLGTGSRPDYTFYLPKNKKINMDVKFPLDNYLRFVEEQDPVRKAGFQQQFLRDIRNRIKEVNGRDYINPEDNTLDYMLIFIPNERIYEFMLEVDSRIMDEALQQRVVLCSPLTLYAFLAVIRQAVDNFHLEQATAEIIRHLKQFDKQWVMFSEALERLGKRINDAQKEYVQLVTTRRKALERPLSAIEMLRSEGQYPTELEVEEDNQNSESE